MSLYDEDLSRLTTVNTNLSLCLVRMQQFWKNRYWTQRIEFFDSKLRK